MHSELKNLNSSALSLDFSAIIADNFETISQEMINGVGYQHHK